MHVYLYIQIHFFYTTFCSSHRQEAMTFTQRKKKIKYEIMQNIPKLNLALKEHEYHAYIWSLFGFRHVSPNMVFIVAYVSIIKAYILLITQFSFFFQLHLQHIHD
jgi:hypothetical protein